MKGLAKKIFIQFLKEYKLIPIAHTLFYSKNDFPFHMYLDNMYVLNHFSELADESDGDVKINYMKMITSSMRVKERNNTLLPCNVREYRNMLDLKWRRYVSLNKYIILAKYKER